MFMTNQQPAKLAEPGVGSFHDSAALITPQFAPIFVAPFLIVLPVRRDQFNASLLQPLPQRVRIVAAVGDYAFRFLPRPAFRRGTRTSASVASASLTSAGEALSSRTPSGRP